jgi:hypothetical protein
LNCSEVYPNLWIGAHPQTLGGSVSEIKEAGFTLHLDCRGECPPVATARTEIQTAYLPLWDDGSTPLTQDVIARVRQAGKNIAACVRAGRKTLITCMGGFNRSALVAAFALHELTGKSGAEVTEIIREARGLPTPELVKAAGITHDPPRRALNNPQFVAAILALETKTYDADCLIYDAVGGAYTAADADGSFALGGSELEVTQIARALAAKGHKVTVATGATEAKEIEGVRYVPLKQAVGQRVKTLYVQRHSPMPQVDADHTIIRSTDMNEAGYRTHDAILASGNAELLCVSKWQAGQFQHAIRRAIVPSPLGAMPKVDKVPGRFVFASSAAKGLEPTLGVWMHMKAAYGQELASAKLLVTAPSYKFGRAPTLTQSMKDAGVEYVPAKSMAHYRELIASARGVFYACCYQETACMIAAMCERSHTRFHFWPMTGLGGVPEMLTNSRLTADSQDKFESDFMAAWREPDRAEWYAAGKLKDLSVDAVLPIWEHALHLADHSAHEDKLPLYIAADSMASRPGMPQPFIATPAYGGMLTMPYTTSLVSLMCGMQKLGLDPTLHLLGNESLITRARNNCVADFLASRCTHLFFIDSDIGFTAQHAVDMMTSGLDVVFGAYPKKSIEWNNVLRAAQEGIAKTPEDLAQYMAGFALNFTEDSVKTGEFKVLERGGLAFMPVKEASTGFCCISRAAIERMIEAYGSELEYVSDSNLGYGEKRYALFDCPICPEGDSDAPLIALRKAAKAYAISRDDVTSNAVLDAASAFATATAAGASRYLSEDYGFSRRWASLGGEVYVYVGAALTHTGTHTFYGDFRKMFTASVDDASTYTAP